MRRKYNPALKTMVDNWRVKLAGTGTLTTDYTDEELFKVIDYWYAVEDDKGNDVQEEEVTRDVKNGTKR